MIEFILPIPIYEPIAPGHRLEFYDKWVGFYFYSEQDCKNFKIRHWFYEKRIGTLDLQVSKLLYDWVVE